MKRLLPLILLLLPATAGAHENGRFGDPGVMVASGRLALTVTHVEPPEGTAVTATAFDSRPGLLYFVTRNLAVGGSLLFGYRTTPSGEERLRTLSFGITPQAGYNVRITNTFSFFPSLGFTYERNASQVGQQEEARLAWRRGYFGIDMPLLIHLGNLFIGGGPYFNLDVSSKSQLGSTEQLDADKTTEIGFQSLIGGWF